MIERKDIHKAYLFLRENEHTIPSETLEFIKRAALRQWMIEFNGHDAACACGSDATFYAMSSGCPVHGVNRFGAS